MSVSLKNCFLFVLCFAWISAASWSLYQAYISLVPSSPSTNQAVKTRQSEPVSTAALKHSNILTEGIASFDKTSDLQQKPSKYSQADFDTKIKSNENVVSSKAQKSSTNLKNSNLKNNVWDVPLRTAKLSLKGMQRHDDSIPLKEVILSYSRDAKLDLQPSAFDLLDNEKGKPAVNTPSSELENVGVIKDTRKSKKHVSVIAAPKQMKKGMLNRRPLMIRTNTRLREEVETRPFNQKRNYHWWTKKRLPKWIQSRKEQKCLAEAIYFEARGESQRGRAAVGQVVLNRVKNPSYPATVCGVVYQNQHKRNACQFSFACDGKKERITNTIAWSQAKQIAKNVSTGKIQLPGLSTATHYHAVYVKPTWSSSMFRQEKIGKHIFYKTRFGGWS